MPAERVYLPKRLHRLVLGGVLAVVFACGAGPTGPSSPVSFAYDFRTQAHGWTCDSAEYSTLTNPANMRIITEYRPLIGSLADGRSAWLLKASNLSEDLFLFCKKFVTGLEASRSYVADLTVQIATNTAPGCGAIGTAPQSSVYVKAGLAMAEPIPFVSGTDVRINLAKGQNSIDGAEAVTLGNIAKAAPGPCTGGDDKPWELKTLAKSTVPLVASANGDGWLVFGIDMAAAGERGIFVTTFDATFR